MSEGYKMLLYHRRLSEVKHISLDMPLYYLSFEEMQSVVCAFPSLRVLEFYSNPIDGLEVVLMMLRLVSDNLTELEELSILDDANRVGWFPDIQYKDTVAWSAAMNTVLSRCNKLHTLHMISLLDMGKLVSSSVKRVICQVAYPSQIKDFRSTLRGFSVLVNVVFQRISVVPKNDDADSHGMGFLDYFDTVWLPSFQGAAAELGGSRTPIACLSTRFMLSGFCGDPGDTEHGPPVQVLQSLESRGRNVYDDALNALLQQPSMALATARVKCLLLGNMQVTVGVADLVERFFTSALKLRLCTGIELSNVMLPRFILGMPLLRELSLNELSSKNNDHELLFGSVVAAAAKLRNDGLLIKLAFEEARVSEKFKHELEAIYGVSILFPFNQYVHAELLPSRD